MGLLFVQGCILEVVFRYTLFVFSDGFRKVLHLDTGAIKCESDDVEFHHSYFVRGKEHLLENIKRKSSIGVSIDKYSDPSGHFSISLNIRFTPVSV